MKKKKLTRIYVGKEILCKECKTKRFRTIVGYPKEEYGCIGIHNKNCSYIKKLLNRKDLILLEKQIKNIKEELIW